jgi:hypothetical protein
MRWKEKKRNIIGFYTIYWDIQIKKFILFYILQNEYFLFKLIFKIILN